MIIKDLLKTNKYENIYILSFNKDDELNCDEYCKMKEIEKEILEKEIMDYYEEEDGVEIWI